MNTRVVVTGMGAITPIGNSVEAFWTAVKSNTVGIAPITHFDTADFKCKLAAEVKDCTPYGAFLPVRSGSSKGSSGNIRH